MSKPAAHWQTRLPGFKSQDNPGRSKRKLKPEGYSCPVCGATFSKPESLGGHVTAAHRDVDLDRILELKGYKRKSEKRGT